MIKICFSEPDAIDISGSVVDLSVIHNEILNLVDGNSIEIIKELLVADSDSPAPYEQFLSCLKIGLSDKAVCISVEENCLIITGNMMSLKALASFFRFDLNSSKGNHHHFEYLGFDQFVTENSLPLVIGIA